MIADDLVERLDHGNAVHLLAVNGNGNALFEAYCDIGRLVGSLLGGLTDFKEAGLVILRLVRGVFKVETLVRKVPEVLVL